MLIGAICLTWNVFERCCHSGGRPVVMFGGFYPFIHYILALQKIEWKYFPVVNCAVFTVGFFYWYHKWLIFGASDMKTFHIHGPFRPGLKRFKSEHGNDCMAFYPVNKSIPSIEINAYSDQQRTKVGVKATGKAFNLSHVYHRKINGLVPDGPLDPLFANGEKKLIPIVYCHGNQACGEEAYGASMILASHGYLVISLDFMDKSATVASDKDGNDIKFEWPKGRMKNKDGTVNWEFQNE